MRFTRAVFITTLAPALALVACAQVPSSPPAAPPPIGSMAVPPPSTVAPPPAGVPTQSGMSATHNSRVRDVVYGPQGEEQALVLRDGVSVTLPPDLGMRLQSTVTRGTRIQVSGTQQKIAGQNSLIAQSVTANGQTFAAVAPVPAPGLATAPAPGPRPDAAMAAVGAPPPPPPPPGRPCIAARRRGPAGPPPPPPGPAGDAAPGVGAPPPPPGPTGLAAPGVGAPPPPVDRPDETGTPLPSPDAGTAPTAPPPQQN